VQSIVSLSYTSHCFCLSCLDCLLGLPARLVSGSAWLVKRRPAGHGYVNSQPLSLDFYLPHQLATIRHPVRLFVQSTIRPQKTLQNLQTRHMVVSSSIPLPREMQLIRQKSSIGLGRHLPNGTLYLSLLGHWCYSPSNSERTQDPMKLPSTLNEKELL
jgi:hypothetical protein